MGQSHSANASGIERPDMNPESSSRNVVENTLERALAEYCGLVDRGETPDRAELMARYPQVKDELGECLACFDFIQEAAPQSTEVSGQNEEVVHRLGDFRLIQEFGRGVWG